MGRFLILAGLLCCGWQAQKSGNPRQEVVVIGTVVCMTGTGEEVSCAEGENRYGFRSVEGETYVFLPEDPRAKLFDDPEVRQKLLQVRGWLRDPNGLEIIKVRSMKGHRLFDLYYFCETCNIKTFSGGLCWCCQKELQLREIPVVGGS